MALFFALTMAAALTAMFFCLAFNAAVSASSMPLAAATSARSLILNAAAAFFLIWYGYGWVLTTVIAGIFDWTFEGMVLVMGIFFTAGDDQVRETAMGF